MGGAGDGRVVGAVTAAVDLRSVDIPDEGGKGVGVGLAVDRDQGQDVVLARREALVRQRHLERRRLAGQGVSLREVADAAHQRVLAADVIVAGESRRRGEPGQDQNEGRRQELGDHREARVFPSVSAPPAPACEFLWVLDDGPPKGPQATSSSVSRATGGGSPRPAPAPRSARRSGTSLRKTVATSASTRTSAE